MKAHQSLRQTLVIAGEAAKTSHPSETTLDHPTTRQQDKTVPDIGQFDHFQADTVLPGSFSRLLTRVSLVNESDFNRMPRGGLYLLRHLGHLDAVLFVRAIADILVPSAAGDNRFWTDSAAALLAACLIRFPNLGEIYNAMNDLKGLAQKLAAKKDDAALLANSFIASVGSDGKIASNVVATLAIALTGWASTDVRANTSASDFDADLVVGQPTVIVLTCPGRMRAVYALYLGATLRKLMLDLDTIGERNKGPLPVPVGVILDEFPALGKLDSLVRKRRISIMIGAQTIGQFHMIYGNEGTQALFTGLATQVIYGDCDADTAEFYSKASGTATTNANTDDPNSHLRQRPLLTVDEVITPQVGNCTILPVMSKQALPHRWF